MNERTLKTHFKKNDWYMSFTQLIALGVNRNRINQLIEKRFIFKITNSLYRWMGVDLDGHDDLYDIAHIEPEGVFCLYTAMNFYHLTSFMPSYYYFAIPRKKWMRKGLQKYPVVIKKWDDKYFNLGIRSFKLGKYSIRMYNLEKTVCDCIRYRNEIGFNTLKEVLTTYLYSNTDKNSRKLTQYAKKMGVDQKLKEYSRLII